MCFYFTIFIYPVILKYCLVDHPYVFLSKLIYKPFGSLPIHIGEIKQKACSSYNTCRMLIFHVECYENTLIYALSLYQNARQCWPGESLDDINAVMTTTAMNILWITYDFSIVHRGWPCAMYKLRVDLVLKEHQVTL